MAELSDESQPALSDSQANTPSSIPKGGSLVLGWIVIGIGFVVAWWPLFAASSCAQCGDAAIAAGMTVPLGGAIGLVGILLVTSAARARAKAAASAEGQAGINAHATPNDAPEV